MKCEIDFHNGTLACSEQNSLSGYCQVSSRSPAMAFYDMHISLRGFPRNCSNASLITKDYSGRSRAHLAVSTERVLFRTSEGAVVKIDFTFHYGPQWHPIRLCHSRSTNCYPCAPLIISFQPPLNVVYGYLYDRSLTIPSFHK